MLLIPLIISPYVTRVLGSEALGNYAFSNTNAYYFVMFAMLGIARYGQRAMATVRERKEELRKAFWSLFFVHCCASVIALIGYSVFFCLFIEKQRQSLYVIQELYVLSALFDVTWFFYGLEDFKSVIYKNFFVKAAELICVFTFVKGPEDLEKYAFIVSASLLFGQMIMLPQVIKRVPPVRFSVSDALKHVKPLLTLWISVVAVALYTVFDKTLLGLMTEKRNVAFYEYADRLVRAPVSLITAIGTVTYPRMCNLLAKDEENDSAQNILSHSITLTAFLACGAVGGFVALATDFGVLYYGEEFKVSGNIMFALSPVILFITLGDILRTQVLIPRKKDQIYAAIICGNSVVNLVASILLIPVWGIYGAVIGTGLAEAFGMSACMAFCRKHYSVGKMIKEVMPFIMAGGLSVVGVYVMKTGLQLENTWLSLGARAGIFGICYVLICAVHLWMKKRELIQSIIRA